MREWKSSFTRTDLSLSGTNEVVHVMCFGDSLTRGYYNKGKNHHPYTNKLQLLLNRLDTRKCIIVDNQGKDGELAFEEMPKRLQDIYENSKCMGHLFLVEILTPIQQFWKLTNFLTQRKFRSGITAG